MSSLFYHNMQRISGYIAPKTQANILPNRNLHIPPRGTSVAAGDLEERQDEGGRGPQYSPKSEECSRSFLSPWNKRDLTVDSGVSST